MLPNIKDLIAGKNVNFQYFRDGELWYRVSDTVFLFPVPVPDAGTATFKNTDKAIFFMRWIRKHLQTLRSDELDELNRLLDGYYSGTAIGKLVHDEIVVDFFVPPGIDVEATTQYLRGVVSRSLPDLAFKVNTVEKITINPLKDSKIELI